MEQPRRGTWAVVRLLKGSKSEADGERNRAEACRVTSLLSTGDKMLCKGVVGHRTMLLGNTNRQAPEVSSRWMQFVILCNGLSSLEARLCNLYC